MPFNTPEENTQRILSCIDELREESERRGLILTVQDETFDFFEPATGRHYSLAIPFIALALTQYEDFLTTLYHGTFLSPPHHQ